MTGSALPAFPSERRGGGKSENQEGGRRVRGEGRQEQVLRWEEAYNKQNVVPVLPEKAARMAATRRVERGRPLRPSVAWSPDLTTDVEPPKWTQSEPGQLTYDKSKDTRPGYGTKPPCATLAGLGIDVREYSKIISTKTDVTESELRESVESFYNRSSDAERMGLRPPLNIRVVCEVEGRKGRVAIPAIIDTGASLNVVSEKYFNRLLKIGYKPLQRVEPRTVVGVEGNPVKITRALRVPIRVYPRKLADYVTVYCMSLGCPASMLLGLDYASQTHLIVDSRLHLLRWEKGDQKPVVGSIGSILRCMKNHRESQRRGFLLRTAEEANRDLNDDMRIHPTEGKVVDRQLAQEDIPIVGGQYPSALCGDGKYDSTPSQGPIEEQREEETRNPQMHTVLRVRCLRERRSVLMDTYDDRLEDYDDQIVSASSDADRDKTQIPVFSSGRIHKDRRIGARERSHVQLRPTIPLTKGHWIFVATVRENYAGTLCWPDVHVRVKEAQQDGFSAEVYNTGEKPFTIGHTKVVGYMEKVASEEEQFLLPMDPDQVQVNKNELANPLHKEELVSLLSEAILRKEEATGICAPLETYDDFIKDRRIVDMQDPASLGRHKQLVWDSVREGIGQELIPAQERQLERLVRRFAHVFSAIKGQSPPVSTYGRMKPFEIQTGEASPIAKKNYHRSPRQRREIEKHVRKMLEDGIVRPSESEWASPVVLAMKKDGTTRFCVNYKPVNEVTQKDRYPLPRIDEILDKLGGRAWFTSLDMSAGYWVIPVAEQDKAKTAFTSHMGLHEFNVMPFGLTNAPAAYQRAMDCVLAGLTGLMCMAYIDDVIVFSSSFEDHCKHLEQVLSRIERAGMTVNARKCSFCRKELVYLGHVVTTDGVKPDPVKVQAVRDAPVPKTVRQVRAFLGLVNYYRRYIPKCSVVQSPLSSLCKTAKKGEKLPPFNWTERCQRAFEKLKEILVSEPLMRHPDFSRNFRVDVDSCAGGVGGVLTQIFDDGEHPVAYYSKTFTVDEAKWSSNELEAIGVIKVLDHFRPYIWGVDFSLLSDNMSVTLAWLKGRTTGKLARWAARLAEFEGYMTILPRSGRKHGNADGLSRMAKDPNEIPTSGDDCMGLGVSPRREESILQTADSAFMSIISNVENAEPDHDWVLALTVEEEAELMSKVTKFHDRVWKTDDGKRQRFAEEMDRDHLVTELRTAQRGSKAIQLEYARVHALPNHSDRHHRTSGGMLERRYTPAHGLGKPYWVPVVAPRLRRKVMASYHDEGVTQHLGSAKTLALLKQRYWWRGMDKDVRAFVRACPWCQKYKAVSRTSRNSPVPKVVRGPNKMLSIDIAGPFDKKVGIPLFILTVVDVWSNYGEVYPLQGTRTMDVLDKLNQNWILRHGAPDVVLTDRGSQFEGGVMARWFRRMNIEHRRTTAYHPQTNAQAERFHRWIRERLSIRVEKDGGDWYEYLAQVVYSHNVSPIEGMGDVSPFLIWYGRKPSVKGDGGLSIGSLQSTALTREEMDKVNEQLSAVKERGRAKRHAQVTASGPTVQFEEGDLVLIRRVKGAKLDPKWDGPWPVLRKITPSLYEVRRRKWGKLRKDVVNISRMCKFNMQDPPPTVEGLDLDTPPGLSVRTSTIPGAGMGVISERNWPRSHIFGEYAGETITQLELDRRYPDGRCTYVVQLQETVDGEVRYVDALDLQYGNWARFMNAPGPNEEPNIRMEEYEGRIIPVATRDIVVGEELLWDYGPGFVQEPRDSTNNAVRRNLLPTEASVAVEDPVADRHEAADEANVELGTGRNLSVEEQDLLSEFGNIMDNSDSHAFDVDDYVVAYSEDFDGAVTVGRISEVDPVGDGRYKLWIYGSYNMGRPIWKRLYKAGWLDTSDSKVLFAAPKSRSCIQFERWFRTCEIILKFQPLQGRGWIKVPERKGRAAAMVRDMATEANGGVRGVLGALQLWLDW